jgi:uncharacterized repeat protein (TIGR01451 family)
LNGPIGFLLCLLSLPLSAATFTVTSPLDSGPGTLRQAILDANALGAGPHTIAFNILPAGPHTIVPESALPVLTASETLLDATTQPGYTGAPIIEISGLALAGADGLRIDGAKSRVQGFAINRFSAAIDVTASGVQVMNNYLGLELDGLTVRPNFRGVFCNDCGALEIGSPAGNDRNVISGNIQGIYIAGGQGNNIIRSNYIGTDATGMFARGNYTGIDWTESRGRIGDAAAGGANVISGNREYGVQMTGLNFDASITHNLIGVAADGTTPLGNGFEGISLYASGTSISENTIAHKLGHGVMVVGLGHERNAIRHNSIHTNRLRGIALGDLGDPTPNDPRDADGGAYANNLQNHPVLTSAVWNAGSLTIRGTLNSIPNTAFLIDFFSNTACDPSGFGEGEVWRQTVQVTTNTNGDAPINVNFAYPGTGVITATATNRDAGETSEFSQCRTVTNALASTVQLDSATSSVEEGAGFATVIVTRSGSSAGPATVEVVTSAGTASTPDDYLPPASSLVVWNDGDGAPQTVLIPIVADGSFEPPEQFSVELRNATGAALGATKIATVTIEDDAGGNPMPADLSIGISTPSSVAAQGEPVTYEIITVNNGPNDATGVTMTSALPAQLLFTDITAPPGWACTTPASGANGTITCTSAVLPAANGTSAHFLVGTIVAFDATGSIVNNAAVSHLGTDPNPGNSFASSNATTVTPTIADLSVTKTTDRPKAAGRSVFPYTITVTNSGPGTASRVTMTDVLPPQLLFVSRVITTTAGTDFSCTTPEVNRSGTITCNADGMAPGATATLTLQVRVVESATTGTVRNTATVTSPTADPDTTDRSAAAPAVELVPGADLAISKDTTTTAARPGAIFDYRISIQNTGPSAADSVVLTDVLPADLLFESIGPLSGFTCTTPAAGTNGTVTCTAPTLPTLTVVSFTLRVRVAPGAGPGTVRNSATVTSSTLDQDDDDMTAAAFPVTLAPPAGAERRLDPNTAPPRNQTAPQVATTRENALAVWREDVVPVTQSGGTASIRGALFRPDAEGETLIEFAAPQQGTDVADPDVAAAADRYLVVWRESRPGQGRILARRIRIDGSFIDAQPLVLETGDALVCCSEAGDPRPAVASNGRDFYVTWVSASYEVRGIVVPAEGPVAGEPSGEPSILSHEADDRLRGHYDLAVVWTSAVYAVVWLDRIAEPGPPQQQSFGLRYVRVTSGGVLLDPQTNTIVGPAISSITATSFAGGAVVTVDYDEHGEFPASRQWCVGVVLLTASGEPGDLRSLRCDNAPGLIAAPALHSTLVPVAGGFQLVQPGRRNTPPFNEVPVRTSSADEALTSLSDPTVLDAVAREAAVANWQGSALLVYDRTDGESPATFRVFAFLMEGPGRGRAVRH